MNADRPQCDEEKQSACSRLETLLTQREAGAQTELEEALWDVLLQYEHELFHTSKGLEFTYRIRGHEIFFSRKEKSITRSSVNRALAKVLELDRSVPGPKKLECFGASYLYPVFRRIGLIAQRVTGPV